jgi:hypothetical protein
MIGFLLFFFLLSPLSLLVQEDGVNLLTIIKGTSKYRRSRRLDFVSNYVPPSMSEFKRGFEEVG